MGLFEWIGESIGGAFHALAEFFGDVFSGIIGGVGSMFKGVSQDLVKDVVGTAKDSGDTVHKDASTLNDLIAEPIEKGFTHTVQELEKKHSEITPQQANIEVQKLWEKIRTDMGVVTTLAIAIEAASVGQLESPMTAFQIADKISGATNLAATIQQMRFKAEFLVSYERYLNMVNPNAIPGPGDLIRFALREVWDPTRRDELLREGYPWQFANNMFQQGFNQDWSDSYWASHWILPSVGQLNDMLHRRIIDDKTWDRFVKYNDYDPTVRPWLKAISYEPYTRVDVRRMWELGLVTDQELTDTYRDLGYDIEHAKRLALWTKIYVIVPDLRARYQKGWLSAQDVADALLAEGMPADKVNNYMEQIVKADQPARVAAEKDLTKSEIIKGVTKGFLSEQDAIDMLIQMGYTQDEAEYIVLINTQSATGSPETYSEFQDIINKHQKALGKPIRPIPQAILDLEKQIHKYEQVLIEAAKNKEDQIFIDHVNKQLAPLKRQYQHLIKK